tara:strand:+ start:124 stop:1977 length:1854 start_codon:yes stop_codon:yes gene_type:complete
MVKIINLINFFLVKFIACLILKELFIIRKKIDYLKFFFTEISLIKYLIYLIDEKTNPFKIKEFCNFLESNKKKWNKNDKKKNKNQNKILIEGFINQPFYLINNILIGKYLEMIKGYSSIAFLRKGDLRGKFIFESFGIKNIYYYNYGGFFVRILYLFKAFLILRNIKSIKELHNFKINNIDIGLLTYDTFLRYTRVATTDKLNLRLINFFSEALYANDYINKVLNRENISELVQSEKQFIPLNIIFQNFLTSKKRKIYARIGTNKLTVRIYSDFNQRYEEKTKFSKSALNYMFKNKKKLIINKLNKYYNYQFNNKLYGKAWATLVDNDPKTIFQWKKNWEINKLNNKSVQRKRLIDLSRDELCNQVKWSKKNKIVTIFLPHMIDGNYQNGRKNLYKDNYSWTINTIKFITKIKNVNWIIREHPQEKRYNTISNFPNFLNKVLSKNLHIISCPININPSSLIKITDIALTSHGTAGKEYQSFGIPVVVAEKSAYDHFGFRNSPKNIYEYTKILRNIYKVPKPTFESIVKAKTLLFINYEISKTISTFVPNYIPEFESRMDFNAHKVFWKQIKIKNKIYEIKKDPFFNMFKQQIFFKNRHTINFNKYHIKNKKFNDLYE